MLELKCGVCGASTTPINIQSDRYIFPKSQASPVLTDRDYAKLEALCYLGMAAGSVARVEMEMLLRNASVISAEEAPPDLVTLGSQLRYRLGVLPIETRRLMMPGAGLHMGAFITVDTALGIALIGRYVPDRVQLLHSSQQEVTLLQLEFQPERELRKPAAQALAHGAGHKRIQSDD